MLPARWRMAAFDMEVAFVDGQGVQTGGFPFTEWRSALASLKLEWHDAVRRAGTRWLAREQTRVRRWQVRLGELESLQTRLRGEGLWYHGRPDMLGILQRARRETFHSLMLAWLLDPGTPHGLGTEFLRGFLKLVGADAEDVSEEELLRVDVSCEVVGPAARTDLVISGKTFTVAVEVKVDAGEQDRQLARMYLDLQDHPTPCFVFLTPGGRKPKTHGDLPEDDFRCLSFRAVRDTLGQVVTARIDDFIAAVEQVSLGDLNPTVTSWSTAVNYLQTLRQEFR